MKNLARSLVLVLLPVSALVVACKSKSSACANVTPSFDPVAKDLEAIAQSADTAPPPSPADQASCAQLTDRARRLEAAGAKLAVITTDDATLAKHLKTYREHVESWAKATQQAQLGCLARDGNAMTSGMTRAIQARADLKPAAAEITTYCKAP